MRYPSQTSGWFRLFEDGLRGQSIQGGRTRLFESEPASSEPSGRPDRTETALQTTRADSDRTAGQGQNGLSAREITRIRPRRKHTESTTGSAANQAHESNARSDVKKRRIDGAGGAHGPTPLLLAQICTNFEPAAGQGRRAEDCAEDRFL